MTETQAAPIGDEDTDNLATVTAATAAEVVDTLEADRIRVRVIQLRDEMSQGYFEMGALLHRISVKGLYTQWRKPDGKTYEHFREYVEHEVDFAFRKAKHLMSIWWWFAEELGDPAVAEKVKAIGWTKAAALVGVVDGKNVDKWVEKAKNLGVKELGEETRMALEKADRSRRPARSGVVVKPQPETTLTGEPSTKGAAMSTPAPLSGSANQSRQGVDPLSDGEIRDHRSRWTIYLDGEQRKNVETAIDAASEVAEVEADGKGFLLDLIATNFLATHAGASGNNIGEHKVNLRNEILRAVERSLGVDLVAFDQGTSDAIFGLATLDRVAAGEAK